MRDKQRRKEMVGIEGKRKERKWKGQKEEGVGAS